MIELEIQCSSYQEYTLPEQADALITDPPYGARTHVGHDSGGPQILSATGQTTRRELGYSHFTPELARDLVIRTKDIVRGWRVIFTSHDLVDAYMRAYEEIGLYSFAPVPVIKPVPRLLGDGPASWATYLCVARPRTQAFRTWGCLPGAYIGDRAPKGSIIGAKGEKLMAEIVRDYTNPGDLVYDPFCGSGTTGVACLSQGRRFVGVEIAHDTAIEAAARLMTTPIVAPEGAPTRKSMKEEDSKRRSKERLGLQHVEVPALLVR